MNKQTNVVSVKIPSNLAAVFAAFADDDGLVAGTSGGFGVLSFRGSRWRIKHKGDEQAVVSPDGEPIASLQLVLLKGNAAISKMYYAKSFEDGDAAAPDCMSVDGITPDASVAKPQSKTCATCPHNVWGSKITPAGKKTKRCSDHRRVAVLPAGNLKNEQFGGPMLLRIPAASLADLSTYGAKLRANGVAYNTIVTKVGFDTNASYPKLTFSAVRALSADELQIVAAQLSEDAVNLILSQSGEAEHGNMAPDATTLQKEPEAEQEPEQEEEPSASVFNTEPVNPVAQPSPFTAASAPAPAAKPAKTKTKSVKTKPTLAVVPAANADADADAEPETAAPHRQGADADIDNLINELNSL
jgi:hypothetical protein